MLGSLGKLGLPTRWRKRDVLDDACSLRLLEAWIGVVRGALHQFFVRCRSSGDDGDGGALYHDGRAVGRVHLPASVVSGHRHATADEMLNIYLPANVVRGAWISSRMRQQDSFSRSIHLNIHATTELRLDRLSSFASWRSSIMLSQLVYIINLWWSSLASWHFLYLGELRLVPRGHPGVYILCIMLSSQFKSLLCCCH